MQTPTPTEYLDSLAIDYEVLEHSVSFTAQETAQKTHIRGNTLSKVVVIGSENKISMVVVPANCIILQRQLGKMLQAPDLHLVPEYQFKDHFPECEIGAQPPFGELYNMDVFVARELLAQESITFNGGTHRILIRMKTNDFMRISKARKISFGYKVAGLSQPIISHRKDDWHWV